MFIHPALATFTVNDGKIICGDLEYEYVDGYYKVTDIDSGTSTFLGFAISGDYNGNPVIQATTDLTWNNPSLNGGIATITDTSASWQTEFDFSGDNAKITNTITNNYPSDITNAKFYYVLSVETGDTIVTPAGSYIIESDSDKHFTDSDYDLNNIASKILMRGITFNYQDLIDNDFDITDIYITDGNIIGYDGQKIIAIGFTKGNRILASGQTVVIDPTIENGFSGVCQVTYHDQNLTDAQYNFTGLNNVSLMTVETSNANEYGGSIVENNSSTYMSILTHGYAFDGDSSDFVNSNDGSDTNVSYPLSSAYYNGIDAKTDFSSMPLNNTFSINFWMNYTGNDWADTFEPYVCSGAGLGAASSSTESWALLNYYTKNSITFTVGSDSSDVQLDAPYPTVRENHMYTATVNESGSASNLYVDSVLIDSGSYIAHSTGATAQTPHIGTPGITGRAKMFVKTFLVFDGIAISPGEITALYTGHNGTSISINNAQSFTPIQNNSASISPYGRVETVEIMSVTPVISDVTFTFYFTEDTTLIEETGTGTNYILSINQTSASNATSGSIVYNTTSWPEYDAEDYYMKMTTNNTNATFTIVDGLLTIDTGQLFAGDNYLYVFALADFALADNGWYVRSSASMITDISDSLVLGGVLLIIFAGITIMFALIGIISGEIEFVVGVAAVLTLVISSAALVIGLIILEAFVGAMP